ncbi:MAG: VanZ family protein [Clostridium sp.]
MKTFMKKWKWKILILVYLCFIYGNSLTPAAISSKESGYFLAKIQDFLAGAGMDAWWLTEHLVRKAAHFTEYAGLGFLLAMNTGAGIAPVFCLLKGNVTAVLFMPFVDETIQLFVECRSGQISDVAGYGGNCYRDHGYGRFHENDGRFENWQKSCKGKGQRKQEQE